MSPARRILGAITNLGLALVAPLLVLLALNGLLALAGYGRPTTFLVAAAPPHSDVRIPNQDFALQFVPRVLSRGVQSFALRPADSALRVFVLGESAAAGDPEPPFGFARALDVMLREYSTGRRVEIVNTAMTAMNSQVIRRIAAEIAEERPAVFVVYMGNNEVVGPFGPRALPEWMYDRGWLVRTLLAARRSRLGQLFLSWTGQDAGPGREWRGMEMFLDRQVPADDPRLQRMYGYFESNLRDVIRAADGAGASVVLATVPVNLRSCAPFGSMHREGVPADALGGWSRHFEVGRSAQRLGDCRTATDAYQEAAAIDDRWADLSFVTAQCAAALGEDARHLWARARDLDSLRIRVDGRINRIIREVAANPRARTVALMDLEETISAAAVGGTPGDDLFVDHVHLDFGANVIAARATFEALRPLLPGAQFRELPRDPAELEALVRRRLVYDARAELQIASTMYQRKTRPPFVGQLDHDAEMARLRDQLVVLRAAARAVTWPDREQALLAAVAARPDDGVLVQRLAEHYGQGGQVDRAFALVEPRLRLAPWDGDLRGAWFDALARAGRVAEAVAFVGTGADGRPTTRVDALVQVGSKLIQYGRGDLAGPVFQEVVAVNPNNVQALMNLGALAVQAGDAATAVRHLTRALELEPDSAQSMVTLASACVMQGRIDDGLRWYRAATEADPNNHLAWYGLGLLHINAGALREAVQDLTHVTELSPEYVDGHRMLAAAYERLGETRRAAEEQRLAEAFSS